MRNFKFCLLLFAVTFCEALNAQDGYDKPDVCNWYFPGLSIGRHRFIMENDQTDSVITDVSALRTRMSWQVNGVVNRLFYKLDITNIFNRVVSSGITQTIEESGPLCESIFDVGFGWAFQNKEKVRRGLAAEMHVGGINGAGSYNGFGITYFSFRRFGERFYWVPTMGVAAINRSGGTAYVDMNFGYQFLGHFGLSLGLGARWVSTHEDKQVENPNDIISKSRYIRFGILYDMRR